MVYRHCFESKLKIIFSYLAIIITKPRSNTLSFSMQVAVDACLFLLHLQYLLHSSFEAFDVLMYISFHITYLQQSFVYVFYPRVVVDAKNLYFQLNRHRDSSFPEAFLQIAFAVVLNKVYLVSPERSEDALEELKNEIHSKNSLANIIRSVRCQVDLSQILNRQAYDTTHATHLEALLEESKSISSRDLHDSGVGTLCINQTQAVDLHKIRLWIKEILWDKKHGMDVYRCKGVLSVQNSDHLHTLQAVRKIYEIVPARQWRKKKKQMNRIVFISHNLDENILSDSFRGCI
ncbi:uncharacterized protein LOC111317746 [Durio zibethinus]|uniref:Uncharacterized protein LOC111317746 n=1 Tax=Durio zibethinus TaxID=66656 RepID=A0A6P6BFJ3_DURZI|nr:uncharacterized protein LOC111317746 [Durio zibethinus]